MSTFYAANSRQIENLQNDLQKQTKQLINERKDILRDQMDFNKKGYKKLDLGQLFADLSDVSDSKEQRMYHLTDKFQAYLKSLAQSQMRQRMKENGQNYNIRHTSPHQRDQYRNPFKQELQGSQLRDSQYNQFLAKTLFHQPQNKEPEKVTTKKQPQLHYKVYSPSFSRAQSEQTQIGKLKNISNDHNVPTKDYIDSYRVDPVNQLSESTSDMGGVVNDQGAKLQKSLYEQEKILLFNQLNYYIRKFQFEKRQNNILMDHIDRMHAYISQQGIVQKQKNHQTTDYMQLSPYSRKTDNQAKKKEDRLLKLLKLKEQQLEMERQKSRSESGIHLQKVDRFTLFQEQIEAMRNQVLLVQRRLCLKQQKEKQHSNKPLADYHKMNTEMYQHQILHLQNKILSLEQTAMREQKKKETFFSDLVMFKDKMVSMEKENNILKSQIKKVTMKYQQLLDEKQQHALGLNINKGGGYENRFMGRHGPTNQQQQQFQKQQRCLNSQSRSRSKSRSSRNPSVASQRNDNYCYVNSESTTDFGADSHRNRPNQRSQVVLEQQPQPLYRSRSKQLRSSLRSNCSSRSRPQKSNQKRVSFGNSPNHLIGYPTNNGHLYQRITQANIR